MSERNTGKGLDMNLREETLDRWYEWVDQSYRAAEEECCGALLDKRGRREFEDYFGSSSVRRVLFEGGPSSVAYHFASEELVRWWERHPRLTWSEFAYSAGIRDRKTTMIARKAPEARAVSASRAWERLGR